MNILHFSDTHGKLPVIPKKYHGTDVVVILSGDICDNFPDHWQPGLKLGPIFTPMTWRDTWNFRKIDGVEEGRLQNEWIENVLNPYFVKCNVKPENIIAIRGNHDWADFEKYFPNSLNTDSKTITFRDKKIGLLCGVPAFSGEWQDEIGNYTIQNRINALDGDIQILVSHTPPYGILDRGHGESHIGSPELYTAMFGRSAFDVQTPFFEDLRLHLFGHAHDANGAKHFDFDNRKLKCYNAATTRFELEL